MPVFDHCVQQGVDLLDPVNVSLDHLHTGHLRTHE